MTVRGRPPQDVDVLAVLDFEIPCSRSEISGFHPRPYQVKWDASSRWLSSLYRPMRISGRMTIGKTHSTLRRPRRKLGRPQGLKGRERGLHSARTARTSTSCGGLVCRLKSYSLILKRHEPCGFPPFVFGENVRKKYCVRFRFFRKPILRHQFESLMFSGDTFYKKYTSKS